MKKLIAFILFIVLFLGLLPRMAMAISDPLQRKNNRVGVHILDTSELGRAAKLVNSSGGDWGYVTIPIQSTDRNREKWQKFFNQCREKHVIPILRLATTVQGDTWEKPTLYDSLDFANFLDDLNWPTKNKYVIIYNEPNHAKEWGGEVDPEEYAEILKYSAEIFKNKDFFVLPAGLDAACANTPQTMSFNTYLQKMLAAQPDVFQHIDGWTSHAYPNPAFSGSPKDNHFRSINSFKYELRKVSAYTDKQLPVFITETGWREGTLNRQTIADYYQYAFQNTWDNQQIVAVTPFLLFAGAGEFSRFSLLDFHGNPKPAYLALKNLPKQAGNPESNPKKQKEENKEVLGEKVENNSPLFEKNFINLQKKELKNFFKKLWYTNLKGGE